MGKIGFHVSAGSQRGLGEALIKGTDSGNIVPCVFSVDQNLWPDIQRFSPQTTYVYRTQPRVYHGRSYNGGLDGPPDIYIAKPKQAASDWMNAVMPTWAKNPAHYHALLNEQDPAIIDHFKWQNEFTIECLNIAKANGFKLALYAFSAGNPKDFDQPAVGKPFTRYDAWRELVPSLQQAKAEGGILLLHEYGFGSPTLRLSAPHLALRYRSAYRFLSKFNADPPLMISEAGAGVGFANISPSIWLYDLKWYDTMLMADKAVIGACAYQLGGVENFVNIMPEMTNYIKSTPTAKPIGFPVVPGPDLDYEGKPVALSVPPDEIIAQSLTVQASILNVRRLPSVTAPVAYTVTRGQRVQVMDKRIIDGQYTWATLTDGNFIAVSRTTTETYLA